MEADKVTGSITSGTNILFYKNKQTKTTTYLCLSIYQTTETTDSKEMGIS